MRWDAEPPAKVAPGVCLQPGGMLMVCHGHQQHPFAQLPPDEAGGLGFVQAIQEIRAPIRGGGYHARPSTKTERGARAE